MFEREHKMETLTKFIELLKSKYPNSKLQKIEDSYLNQLVEKYPNMPTSLIQIYKELGYGTIGESLYYIHIFLQPDEIYDELIASLLEGKIIVGDDFAGYSQAYDTKND